jgi:hypothetical protein
MPDSWLRACHTGRDTSALLDLVEEPFDDIARTIQIRAEADRVSAISLRRNVCPCPFLSGKLPDPIRVICTIREQHRLWKQGVEKNRTRPIVVRFARREREMDWQAIGVHRRVNLARWPPDSVANDPNVWSGRALQVVSPSWR